MVNLQYINIWAPLRIFNKTSFNKFDYLNIRRKKIILTMSKRHSENIKVNEEGGAKKIKPLDIQFAVELQIADRPGLGKDGRPIKLKANFLKVNTLPQKTLFHYNFVVEPPVKTPL